jgi:hypothetical protein
MNPVSALVYVNEDDVKYVYADIEIAELPTTDFEKVYEINIFDKNSDRVWKHRVCLSMEYINVYVQHGVNTLDEVLNRYGIMEPDFIESSDFSDPNLKTILFESLKSGYIFTNVLRSSKTYVEYKIVALTPLSIRLVYGDRISEFSTSRLAEFYYLGGLGSSTERNYNLYHM